MMYKRSPTLQAAVRDHFPLSPHEFFELSTHPIITTVHLEYQTTECRAITSKEDLEPR
jgi:hypothetical protein